MHTEGDPRPAQTVPTDARAPDYRLVPFGPGCADRSAELSRLHAVLLRDSPVALLGPDFMRRFYYRVLPESGLIRGYLAYVEGNAAGFIVVARDSFGFMRTALRRHLARILGVLTWSVLRNPTRLGALWEAVQIMRAVPTVERRTPDAEILSFGVLPEYRSREFTARARLRIAHDLLAAALRDCDAKRVRVIVDADNIEARLFYLGNGWQPGATSVPGWRKRTVEFHWTAPIAAAAGAFAN